MLIEAKDIFKDSSERLKKLRNSFEGRACAIVGNGPSLAAKDLERIKNSYSFGVNKIYDIYPYTSWRPTFYAIQDYKLMKILLSELDHATKDSLYRFFNARILNELGYSALDGSQDYYFKLENEWNKDAKITEPSFSEDFSELAYEGYTVTYTMIQLAVYLGFTSIYLLGIDHNYSFPPSQEGILSETTEDNYFTGYKPVKNVILNAPRLERSEMAYQKAFRYCNEHGIKIFNATRGGNLEVFPRIPFMHAAEELRK